MRATLVIELVKAFNEGAEAFIKAAELIAEEESRKGNDDIAKEIRNALQAKGDNVKDRKNLANSSLSFQPSSMISPVKQVPKDKDSAFELFELLSPTQSLDQLVFPEQIENCLKQISSEWKNSQRLIDASLQPTQRVLFYGPPGCGKTAAGLALAREIGLNVAYVRLDSVFSSFLGQTSTNIRRIFDAVKTGPIALFLDEFDAIAKKRDDSQEVGELKRIVISLLQNLDSLPNNVLVIAATNHEHLLDPAVWRRFDMTIAIQPPTSEQRKSMLSNWLSNYPMASNLSLDFLVNITEGLSPSRIQDLVRQAAKNALYIQDNAVLQAEDFTKTLLLQETGFQVGNDKDESSALIALAKKMNDAGVSLRDLAALTGIPKSTLSDYLKHKESDHANA